jgi:hypothetical protein
VYLSSERFECRKTEEAACCLLDLADFRRLIFNLSVRFFPQRWLDNVASSNTSRMLVGTNVKAALQECLLGLPAWGRRPTTRHYKPICSSSQGKIRAVLSVYLYCRNTAQKFEQIVLRYDCRNADLNRRPIRTGSVLATSVYFSRGMC